MDLQIPLVSQISDAPEHIARGLGEGEIPDPYQDHWTCRYSGDGY